MKSFRWKDRRVLAPLSSPESYKSGVIEPLLKQFPNRRFVLVGDSGEKDPEIYAQLARKHPRQIAHIFIRNVTHEGQESERYRRVFGGIPPTVWTVFEDPSEIPAKDFF